MLAGAEARMGKPYSVDLRERVVAAVETGRCLPLGSGAIRLLRQHSHSLGAALPTDRQRCAGSDGRAQADVDCGRASCLVAGAEERDFTLRGLLAELAERGLKVDYRTVWSLVHAEKLSFKKRPW
jgi:hypothetical protein